MKLFRRKGISLMSKNNFLPIFSRQIVYILKASDALLELVNSTDHLDWKFLEKEVKQCELHGDALLSEFYEVIYDNIVPVLDRDDLQIIALDLDRFLDLMNTSAKSILLYLPDKIDRQLVELAQFIKAEAESLKLIIELLADVQTNFSAIITQCDRISELEHAGDESYEEYIGEIFKNEKNAINLMKYKNIAEVFEETTDAAKKVSDHIRKLLLRYM